MFIVTELNGFGIDIIPSNIADHVLQPDNLTQSAGLDTGGMTALQYLTPQAMLQVAQLSASSLLGGGLKTAIDAAGFGSNDLVVLDAGDAASYSGTGQVWSDLSGNGVDFNRGAGASVASDDPTFNGTAGALTSNEYWSFDGGDLFRAAASNPAWVSALHQDGAAFTALALIYVAPSSDRQGIFGTWGLTSGSGISWGLSASEKQEIWVVGDGYTTMFRDVMNAVTTNAWHFLAVSIAEGNTGFFYRDGAYDVVTGPNDTFMPSYDTPSAGAAAFPLEVGAIGNATWRMASGSRLAGFGILDQALSKAGIDSIYNGVKSRFGL